MFPYFQLEVVSDVISGVNVEHARVDVSAKFGDSRSDRSRDVRLPHFVTDDGRTTMPVDEPCGKNSLWS